MRGTETDDAVVEAPTMRRYGGWLDEPAPPTEPIPTSRPAWPLIDLDDDSRLPIMHQVLKGLRAL